MPARDEDVKSAFRRERRRVRMADLRRAAPYLIGIAALLALMFYWFAAPMRSVGVFTVDVIGYHVVQSEIGRGPPIAQVRFDDGRLADVALPRGSLPRRDARMRVEVFRSGWPPRGSAVAFRGFVEPTDQTDTLPEP